MRRILHVMRQLFRGNSRTERRASHTFRRAPSVSVYVTKRERERERAIATLSVRGRVRSANSICPSRSNCSGGQRVRSALPVQRLVYPFYPVFHLFQGARPRGVSLRFANFRECSELRCYSSSLLYQLFSTPINCAALVEPL